MQALSRDVVEVVVRVKCFRRIVVCTEVLHPFGTGIAPVLSGHMIRNEVDDHFQSCLMRAAHEIFKFLHAVRHVGGQVGINVVIVLDGIRRSGTSFHHGGMVGFDTIFLIVCLRGMLQQPRKPYVGKAEIGNTF